MRRFLEDLTVGDFEGLSVEAIADILREVKRRGPDPAVLFKQAEEAANELMKLKYYE